jgi:hypothetical protein
MKFQNKIQFEVHLQKKEVLLSDKNVKCKGIAIPSQALTDPEGSRRLRLPDFKTIGT